MQDAVVINKDEFTHEEMASLFDVHVPVKSVLNFEDVKSVDLIKILLERHKLLLSLFVGFLGWAWALIEAIK